MDLTDRLYVESVLKLLLRDGVVSEDAVLAMADEQDLLAERNPREAEARGKVAHALRVVVLDHSPPPAVDPRVTFEAEFRRKQMVERTAMLARERGE